MNLIISSITDCRLTALLFSLLFAQMIHAQHTPINVGDDVFGVLEFQGDVKGYTFCSAANVPIYIRASSEEITFLRIELYDESGELKSTFSSIVANIRAFTRISGEHTILVKSQNGNEQGKYSLSLQRTINPIDATPLVCNDATMNSVDFVTKAKPFTFSVSSGTTVNITLSSSEITFVRMELYNTTSKDPIDSAFSSLVAEIQITLNEAGCYSLFVMSQNGDDMGSFSLAQNVTTGQCSGVCPVNEICNNQIDDDGDGLIDCQDEDCCNFFILPVAEINGGIEFCEGDSSILTASGGNNYLWSTGADTASITVVTGGTYSVTVTNDNGCSGTKSVDVVVNDLPVIDINARVNNSPIVVINSELEICAGDAAILMASGGLSYTWNTGENSPSINVNSFHSNTYEVVVTDENGCTDSRSINVVVHELPIAVIDGEIEFCEGEVSTLTASGGVNFTWSTGVNVESINVFASNDYSVTVTDENGCSDSETVKVVAHNLPIATIDGDLEICKGETSTLIANGGVSYIWSTGEENAIISVSESNTYSVTITDNNGCTDSENVNVIVFDLPIITFSLETDTICIDEPNLELRGGVPLGGTYSGIGVINDVFHPSAAGLGIHELFYTYTDFNGCSNIESVNITVIEECATSINSAKLPELIEVFPNPSNGSFVVQLDNLKEEAKLKILNNLGQEIFIEDSAKGSLYFNHLHRGVYFILVIGKDFRFVKKIIVQ